MTQPEKSGNFVKESTIALLAGALAGGVADFSVHPIDTVRTRLQVQKSQGSNAAYRGTAHAFSSIIKNEGFTALYKGIGIVLASTIPAHALYFGGYEISKMMLKSDKIPDPVVHFASGGIADICGSFIWVPMDVVKQRLQIQKKDATGGALKYKGSWHALQTIFQEEGVRGLFKGYWAAIATYGPFVAIYFTAYEQFKKASQSIFKVSTEEDLPFVVQLVNGGTAGGLAACLTNPMDVIKTRMQVQSTKASGDATYYRGIFHAVKSILQEEGVSAFGKGLYARILWIAPGTAITIALYEQFKSGLDKRF